MRGRAALGSVLAWSGLLHGAAAQQATPRRITDYRPVTQEMLSDPEPADWLQWRRTYENSTWP